MKRIFLCYSIEQKHLSKLQSRLELITLAAHDQNMQTFAHIRDAQNWHFHNEPIKTILSRSFREIESSDAVLLDLTTHSELTKRTGLCIEAGYASALLKPIFALWHDSDRPNMITDLADYDVAYSSIHDIRDKVTRMLSKGFHKS